MKKTIIKTAAVVATLVALVLLLGDLPKANMVHVAFVKICGLALLWGAVKVWEANVPEEEI